ncbi:MAG: hypothetical protein M3Y91_06725 [Actinomycetota bacterium]|nr:hypothetical protein [Actinomycetota bacterium]
MTAPVCFVDTETLGLDADHHPIWDVGLVDPDGVEFHWFLTVTPRQIELAHPKALEIGRFDERYRPIEAVDPVEFCFEFEDATRGCHLAGAVVSFDEERLRRMFWAQGVKVGWHYHIVDVEAIAAGWIAGQPTRIAVADRDSLTEVTGAPPWNSTALSRAVGVNPDDYDRHTALGDAKWAAAIFRAVMEGS